MASLFDMNQIGSAQQPQGFMQRGLLNPLTHLGLGLMSASAPRASWDPGGAMPNYAQGLLGGIHSYQQAQQGQAKQQYLQEMMRVRQQQAQAQQQEAQRKQQEEQQRVQAQQQYLLTLPPEQRQQVGALLGMGTSPDKVMGLLNPKQDDRWSDPFIDTSTGKPILVQRNENTGALKSIGSGGTNVSVNVGGEKQFFTRTPTPEEAAQAGIPPEKIGEYVVEGGNLKLRPERGASDAGKRLNVLKGVEDSLNNYEILIAKHGTEYMPGAPKREIEAARTDLLVELKNLYELGALQEPDMVLMEGILKDPTGIGTNIGGILTLGGNKANYQAQLGVIRKKLTQARKNLRSGATPVLPPGAVED